MGPNTATAQSTQSYTDSDFSAGFGLDLEDGHGTHTAGTAAGAVLNRPATTGACATNETLGCIGTCLSVAEETSLLADDFLTWDTLCPQFNCDYFGDPCLGEDVSATLKESGGVAQGAKISVFDVSVDGQNVSAHLAMNGLWESTIGTGSFVHSNSWGSDNDCNVNSYTVAYDEYMYEVCHEAYVCRCAFGLLSEMKALSFKVGCRMTERTWF